MYNCSAGRCMRGELRQKGKGPLEGPTSALTFSPDGRYVLEQQMMMNEEEATMALEEWKLRVLEITTGMIVHQEVRKLVTRYKAPYTVEGGVLELAAWAPPHVLGVLWSDGKEEAIPDFGADVGSLTFQRDSWRTEWQEAPSDRPTVALPLGRVPGSQEMSRGRSATPPRKSSPPPSTPPSIPASRPTHQDMEMAIKEATELAVKLRSQGANADAQMVEDMVVKLTAAKDGTSKTSFRTIAPTRIAPNRSVLPAKQEALERVLRQQLRLEQTVEGFTELGKLLQMQGRREEADFQFRRAAEIEESEELGLPLATWGYGASCRAQPSGALRPTSPNTKTLNVKSASSLKNAPYYAKST